MDELIHKYRGKQRAPSTLCCFTMLLEWVGSQDSRQGLELIAGRFKTILGAKRVLPQILNHPDLDSFMIANGVELIDYRFMQDGDLLVVDGSHSLIYFGGYFFGVSGSDEIFDFFEVNTVLNASNKKQAYRKIKQ
ncbi:hypothetical protein ACEUAG_11475 [Aeromonas hydrophila]|uniref:DUF6950 family protein n=1 Tax=Aeromonas hydrophila TaxID=644 RepID=UPI0038D218C9